MKILSSTHSHVVPNSYAFFVENKVRSFKECSLDSDSMSGENKLLNFHCWVKDPFKINAFFENFCLRICLVSFAEVLMMST